MFRVGDRNINILNSEDVTEVAYLPSNSVEPCPETIHNVMVPPWVYTLSNLPMAFKEYIQKTPAAYTPQLTAILIAIPDPRPKTLICTYAIQYLMPDTAPVVISWMEVTRRPKADVESGIKVLQTLMGHFYGQTELRPSVDLIQIKETRIFQGPQRGVLLRQTKGWRTYVSESGGNTIDRGKSTNDCLKFLDYVLRSMASLFAAVVSEHDLENTLMAIDNFLFRDSFTMQARISLQELRFITWTGSREMRHESPAVLRAAELEELRLNYRDRFRDTCGGPPSKRLP
ncbi:hypothetical protein FRB94_009493 [Tulasnella sp. JGI-2019a]|nr:hypothetical protein FRB93_008373 [Tulasnella sp. JGI-2019a]KAG8995019.1 hypothetical protein FRB94_009493 [Tulasnella sp. JGI-2019a]